MTHHTGTAYTRDLIVDAIENLLALANSNAIKNPRALIRLSHAMSDLDDALQVVSYGDEQVPRYITDRMLSPRPDKKVSRKPKQAQAAQPQQKAKPAQNMAPVREIKRPPRQEWTPPSFRDIEREVFDPEVNRQTMIGVNEDYNLHHNDYLAELGRIVNPEYDPYDEIPERDEDIDEYYNDEYAELEYGDYPPDFDDDYTPDTVEEYPDESEEPIDFSDFSDVEPPLDDVPLDIFDDVYDADFDEDFEEEDIVEEYEDGTSADLEEALEDEAMGRIVDAEANKNAIEDLFANDPNDYIKDIPTHRKQ
jgi:hypothetical protein